MVERFPHCDRRPLLSAVGGQLDDAAAGELSRHLDRCQYCRVEMDQLAASCAWWEEARAYLQDEGAALEVPGAAPKEREDRVRDLLEPSHSPQYLGNLGGYHVESVIGEGGMGIVLKAHDPSLARTVAIKVLAQPLSSSAAARKRFAREARAAAAVVHDHVIPIYSVNTAGRVPYLVMPFVNGPSLDERLREQGTLEIKEVLRLALQVARGLAAAHALGLVHRDIKPANILLEDGLTRVRITDFGLARAIDDASQTQSGFLAGTPQYMAPEQARGDSLDARADLFSLGSVVYAMCAGHSPFRAETMLAVLKRICDDEPRPLDEVNPDVPPWLAEIVTRLLAKKPDERFQSAGELADLIERWLAHLEQPHMHAAPGRIARKWPRLRRRSLWVASGALALVAAAFIGVFSLYLLPGVGRAIRELQTQRELAASPTQKKADQAAPDSTVSAAVEPAATAALLATAARPWGAPAREFFGNETAWPELDEMIRDVKAALENLEDSLRTTNNPSIRLSEDLAELRERLSELESNDSRRPQASTSGVP